MIEKLLLNRFGSFHKTEFIFQDSTNSGKTTIFDALYVNLCRVRRQGEALHDIFERYGEAMEAEIQPEELAESVDPKEFRELYAIRSGDISLTFEEGEWLEKVKSSLFSGGINPEEIAQEMHGLASDNATYRHNRLLQNLRGELHDLRERQGALEKSRLEQSARDKESGET